MSSRHQPENGADSAGALAAEERRLLNVYLSADDKDADAAWETYEQFAQSRRAPFDDRGTADLQCDGCARTIYSGLLIQVDGKMLCGSCVPAEATFDGWMSWLGWQQ